jgi:hypothetical protein
VRSAASRASGIAAFDAAAGCSLCVRMRRLPTDFPALVARLRGADDVLCAICVGQFADSHPPLILPSPIVVPSLSQRPADLDRIIDEYADDAIAELAALASNFTADDRAWVRAQRGDVARRDRGGHAAAGRASHVTQPVQRRKHAAEETRARAESDAQVRELKTKADADQAAARDAAQAEAGAARAQWQAEIDKHGADARKQADKKVAECMAQVEAEEAKGNAEAKRHLEEGKRKADDEKQKGEKEAADAKDKAKHKSSGFWGWVSSKAKAAFDGVKKAVSSAIDACRRAVKAVIDGAASSRASLRSRFSASCRAMARESAPGRGRRGLPSRRV